MAMIRTTGLTKRFGSFVALDGLDLEIAEGEVFGYLGPNGAGKTTTIRLLLGLATPTAGRIELLGRDAATAGPELHREVGYVPGDVALWPQLTGAETLDLLGAVHGGFDPTTRAALIDRFDLDPSKRVSSYSKGNRQKLLLVAAFMARPRLLILDEPTSGLDPLMEEVFKATVVDAVSEGASVMLSSHILSEVEALCDRVGILREGRLVETGTLDDLRFVGAVRVQARFPHDAPALEGIAGVSELVATGPELRCLVQGTMAPLLTALSDAGAVQVISREPSLEELFLAHYDAEAVANHG